MKEFLLTLAGILILAFMGLSDGDRAYASTDVNLVTSSGTHTGVQVTSGTTRRVDNLVRGVALSPIPSTRIGIEIQNQDATLTIFCAYDTNFTTATTNIITGQNLGKRILSGDTVYIGMLRGVAYHCIATDAAGATGPWIHVEQVYKE